MYVHSCRRMNYKPQYKPSELLCPLHYQWVPFEDCVALLDEVSK